VLVVSSVTDAGDSTPLAATAVPTGRSAGFAASWQPRGSRLGAPRTTAASLARQNAGEGGKGGPDVRPDDEEGARPSAKLYEVGAAPGR